MQPPTDQPPLPPKKPRRGLLITSGVVALVVAIFSWLYWLGVADQRGPGTAGTTPSISASAASTPASTPPETPSGTTLAPPQPVPTLLALRGTATIDGATTDWPWSTYIDSDQVVFGDSSGVVGRTQLMWDDQALYFYTEVTDDHPAFSTTAKRDKLWQGDGFTLELGPNVEGLPAATKLRPVDGHYLFALTETPPEVRIGVNRPTAKRNTFEGGPLTPQIVAVSTVTRAGYQIEGMIPWSVTKLNGVAANARFGANLNISDRADSPGRLGSMISSNPQRTAVTQSLPAYWQTLVLQG